MDTKKISVIKAELKNISDEELIYFIKEYENDERSGVKAVVESAYRRLEKFESEKQRIVFRLFGISVICWTCAIHDKWIS